MRNIDTEEINKIEMDYFRLMNKVRLLDTRKYRFVMAVFIVIYMVGLIGLFIRETVCGV